MKSPARRHGADAALSRFPRVGKGKTPGKGIFATREREFCHLGDRRTPALSAAARPVLPAADPRPAAPGAGPAPPQSTAAPQPVHLGRRGQTRDALHRPCAVRRREPRQLRAGRAPGEAARGAGPAGHGALPAPG